MNTNKISYRELATTAPSSTKKFAVFEAVLSIIPDSGCRLFVHHKQRCLTVVDDEGQPKFFPSVELALSELATIPSVDHKVIVDIISLLPSAMTRNRFFDGIGKVTSRILGQSRSGNLLSEST